MIVVKREFQDIDPNEPTLKPHGSRSTDDIKVIKATAGWRDLKADMRKVKQRTPILVDYIYNSDFTPIQVILVDGFKRILAAKSDELNWPSINAIVTTRVQTKDYKQIAPTVITKKIHPATIQVPERFAPGSKTLEQLKTPAEFSSEEEWNKLEETVGTYTEAKTAYDNHQKYAWPSIDAYIAKYRKPERLVQVIRTMYTHKVTGHVRFGPLKTIDLVNSLTVVSCRERGVTLDSISVRTIDETGK